MLVNTYGVPYNASKKTHGIVGKQSPALETAPKCPQEFSKMDTKHDGLEQAHPKKSNMATLKK